MICIIAIASASCVSSPWETTAANFSYQDFETPFEDKARDDPLTLLIVAEKRDNPMTFAKTRYDASTLH
jgi:hypothetical protein